MSKARDKIKKLFSGFSWSRLNWGSIKKSLDIEKKAADDGVNNLPQTDEESHGKSELEIIDKHLEKFGDDDSKLQKHAQEAQSFYESHGKNIIKEGDTVEHAESSCTIAWDESHKKIADTKTPEREERQTLKAFRITNGLTGRTAQFKFRSWCIFGVLFFLILESALNAQFLGEFLRNAWQQALPITLGIALINVGLSYIVGDHALRQLWHHNWKRRMMGGVFLLLWFIVIVNVNGAFANYRAALNSLDAAGVPVSQIGPTAGKISIENNKTFPYPTFKSYTTDVAWPETIQDPVEGEIGTGELVTKSIDVSFDFYSGLLIVIGLIFALVGLLDGLLSDDFFPGYGKKVRNYQSPRKKNKEEYFKVASIINSILSKALKDLTDKKDTTYDAREVQLAIIEELEYYFSSRKMQIQTYEEKINACLNLYKTVNKRSRDTGNKPPQYFKDKYNINPSIKELSESYDFIWEDFGEYLYNKNKKKELKKEMHGNVAIDFKSAKEAIDKIKKDFNEIINKEYTNWIKEGEPGFDPKGPRNTPLSTPPKIQTNLKVVR